MSKFYQLPEKIRAEFYVTNNGDIRAKSWSAIARLAGVSVQSILQRLLLRLNNESIETLPITLQPLAGMSLTGSTSDIPEIVISCIVNYYAWESKRGESKNADEEAKHEEAKKVALALNAIGIRAYFQKELGWHDPNDSKVTHLESLIMNLAKSVDEMKSDLTAFKNTGAQFPGITNIVQNNINVLVLPPDFKEPFSIREWVWATQSRDLSKGECLSIGRMASDTMKTLKLESSSKNGIAKVYRYCDIPALQTIWKSWLLTSK